MAPFFLFLICVDVCMSVCMCACEWVSVCPLCMCTVSRIGYHVSVSNILHVIALRQNLSGSSPF